MSLLTLRNPVLRECSSLSRVFNTMHTVFNTTFHGISSFLELQSPNQNLVQCVCRVHACRVVQRWWCHGSCSDANIGTRGGVGVRGSQSCGSGGERRGGAALVVSVHKTQAGLSMFLSPSSKRPIPRRLSDC